MKSWNLYMLRTSDGTLYTGIATDVARRLEQHANSRGARSLRGRGPLSLVFERSVETHGLALQLEYRIKQLRREEKERLVERAPSVDALVVQFDLSHAPDDEER